MKIFCRKPLKPIAKLSKICYNTHKASHCWEAMCTELAYSRNVLRGSNLKWKDDFLTMNHFDVTGNGRFSVAGIGKGAGVSLLWDGPDALTIVADGQEWSWAKGFQARITTKCGAVIPFSSAAEIISSPWNTGVGRGIKTTYKGFTFDGNPIPFSFATIIWIENSTGNVFMEWIPLCDEGLKVQAVYWPGHMAFEEKSRSWYSVLNLLQGLLVPNDWEQAMGHIHFDGQFCSAGAYMPWYGQVRPGTSYIAICLQPWDAAYHMDHPAGGPYSHVGVRWLPSLGKMDYRRIMRYTFCKDGDYNDLCKVYRQHVKETGLFTSLAEKAAKNPLVDKLIGSMVVHNGIKTHVSPGSAFYDKENPQKNDYLVPFSDRTARIKHYKEKGIEKLYLHLDGWGQPGYDNKHPDYTPACKEAGGWEGMKELSDTMKDCGYMFGIHDQYRDYYFDAATFDKEFGLHDPDGKMFEMARWAGGRQTYMCATQAPYYVKRNFEEVLSHGIHLEATYLDVFTCNEGDECSQPLHRMTRKESFDFRKACFDYLNSKNIVPSSEEVVDWAMQSLVFAHYGPYEFMLRAPGAPRYGISAPLFNLVYHDCMILPWFMDKLEDGEDYMLYAVMNAGIPYLDKDGAYPNTDGAFDSNQEKKLDDSIARCRVVTELSERLAKCEMVKHELLDEDGNKQRATYCDGTAITIDLKAGTYDIAWGK